MTQALCSQEVPDGMTGREKSQWLKCGRIEEEIRIKAVRSMEEVINTSLRELDETIRRDAAAKKHTAAPADAIPSLGGQLSRGQVCAGQTETEMRTDDKEGAPASDGCEGWTMVSEMRTDDESSSEEGASESDGCEGWAKVSEMRTDDEDGWHSRWAWDGRRWIWRDPDWPDGEWRWYGSRYGWWSY